MWYCGVVYVTCYSICIIWYCGVVYVADHLSCTCSDVCFGIYSCNVSCTKYCQSLWNRPSWIPPLFLSNIHHAMKL